jgi:uncharacterized protein (DUF736 family)
VERNYLKNLNNMQNINIFKNKYKQEGTAQPDYKLSAKDDFGNFVEIGAAWMKDGKAGKFLSVKLKDEFSIVSSTTPKEEEAEYKPTGKPVGEVIEYPDEEINADDIPF